MSAKLPPLSSRLGSYKTVRARFRSWCPGESPLDLSSDCLHATKVDAATLQRRCLYATIFSKFVAAALGSGCCFLVQLLSWPASCSHARRDIEQSFSDFDGQIAGQNQGDGRFGHAVDSWIPRECSQPDRRTPGNLTIILTIKIGEFVRATEILVEQEPPKWVFICDHAGRVINESSTTRELTR